MHKCWENGKARVLSSHAPGSAVLPTGLSPIDEADEATDGEGQMGAKSLIRALSGPDEVDGPDRASGPDEVDGPDRASDEEERVRDHDGEAC